MKRVVLLLVLVISSLSNAGEFDGQLIAFKNASGLIFAANGNAARQLRKHKFCPDEKSGSQCIFVLTPDGRLQPSTPALIEPGKAEALTVGKLLVLGASTRDCVGYVDGRAAKVICRSLDTMEGFNSLSCTRLVRDPRYPLNALKRLKREYLVQFKF